MSVCNVVRQSGKRTEVRFDYNMQFVERLKALIPHTNRSYNPKTKVWAIEDAYTSEVVEVAKKYFKKCSLVEVKGDRIITTRLHSGMVEEQEALFKAERI